MAKFPYERTEEEIANAGICENWTVAMIEAEREIIEICPDSGGYPMPEPRDQEKRDQYEADMMEIARDLDSQGSPPEKLPWYDYIMGAGFEMPSADTPPPSDSEMQDVQVLIDHAKNLIGALSVPDIEKILAAHKRRTRIQEVVDETAQVFVADAVANVIVNELVLKYECREEVMFMETGDVYRMQPFRLVDTEYKVVPKEVFMELIAQSETSNEVWTPNWNDCDDIARKMVAEAHSYGLNSVGRVKSWSGGHAFNAAVVSVGDGDLELVFFEPQDQTKDKIVTEEEILGDENSKYSLENALVIIA